MILENAKREAFAQSCAAGTTLIAAAIAAGYVGKRAYKTGSELRKRPDVAARIEEIRQGRTRVAEEHQVYGMRECIAETDEALALARKNGQPSHMVAAITLKAKLVGLLVERRQVDYKNIGELSDSELEALIANAEANARGKDAIDKARKTDSSETADKVDA